MSVLRSILNPWPFLYVSAFFLSCAPAEAQRTIAQSNNVKVELISAVTATGDLPTLPLGLQIHLKPGWKTYWKNPGEAGTPTSITWTGDNVDQGQILWPIPKRFTLLGLETYGYDDEIILPIELKLKNRGLPLNAHAQITMLACNELCVPETFDLDFSLPSGPAEAGSKAQLLNQYQARVPNPQLSDGLELSQAHWLTTGTTPVLLLSIASAQPLIAPDIFPETDDLAFDHPKIMFLDAQKVEIGLPLAQKPREELPLHLPMLIVDGDRSHEVTATITPAPSLSLVSSTTQLWSMMAIAFLGGAILNLMPCVLPVLSLKLLAIAKAGQQRPRAVRLSFMATTLGIIVSFLVLAFALITLKAAGHRVGWGIQFQQPLFITFMSLLLFIFSANLFGWFEISLPQFMNSKLATTQKASLGSDFLTGVLATLLATPCSAPFVGTAIAYALSRGPIEILAVFIAMAIGLSSPFVVLALNVKWVIFLPKPGRWMMYLRWFLGAGLLVTALWLLTILANVIGVTRAGFILALGAIILAVFYATRQKLYSSFKEYKVLPFTKNRHFRDKVWNFYRLNLGYAILRNIIWNYRSGLILVIMLFGMVLSTSSPTIARNTALPSSPIGWAPFNPESIKSQIAQGRTIFVDITADWCLSCKANEKFVLSQPATVERLTNPRIIAMQADWTLPDQGITAYLSHYGRYGIPFNIVFGPKAPDGIVLPELLSQEAVATALKEAAGN